MKKYIAFLIIVALASCTKTELKPDPKPTQVQIVAAKDSVSIAIIFGDTVTVHDARLNVDVFMKIRDSAGYVTITAYCKTTDFAPAYIRTNSMLHGDKILFSPEGTVNKFTFLPAEDYVTEIKLN